MESRESFELGRLEAIIEAVKGTQSVERNVLYHSGEIDLLLRAPEGDVYVEFKSRHTDIQRQRALRQIRRAIAAGVCSEGLYVALHGRGYYVELVRPDTA